MRWPSKDPDDYLARPRWGGSDPASPPLRFGVTILVLVIGTLAALARATGDVAVFLAGCAFVPGAVQAAWWLRRRLGAS